MATTSNDNSREEQFKCPICENSYAAPRKLPECGHQCCEVCILAYVSKLREDGDIEIGFPCLSCKAINPGPKDLKAAIAWIQSLERGIERTPQKDCLKDQTHKDACSSCEVLGKTSEAVKFCLECYEFLCQPCSEIRHTHQIFQNHKQIDIGCGDEASEENKIFQMLCELVTCSKHADKANDFYCNDHEEFGCESCVGSIHKDCCDVVKANTYAEKENIQTGVEQIEHSAKNMSCYAKTMTELKTVSAEAVKQQVEGIKANLKAIRHNAIKVFDKLEEVVMKNAVCAANKQISTAYKDRQTLRHLNNSSTLSVSLLEKLMACECIGLQNILTHKLKERMKSNEEVVLHMSEDVKTTECEFKQGELLTKLLDLGHNNTHELATVTIKETASGLCPFKGRLLLKQHKAKKLRVISTRDKYKKDYPTYTSVKILHDDSIAIVDEGYSCLLIKPNDEVLEPCNLAAEQPTVDTERHKVNPLRLAGNNEELIAVPFPSQNKILLISANESVTIRRTIATKYQPKALHVLKNGDIAVAWNDPVAFGMISVGDVLVETKVYFQKDKSGRQLSSFPFIAVDERRSHVIQPCSSNNVVYCFDFEGQAKFTYTADKFSPRGVALDGDGNIYTCSYHSYYGLSAIHVISPRGSGLHIIGTDEGCVSTPYAITFNKNGYEFAVTQTKDRHAINVFKLQNECCIQHS